MRPLYILICFLILTNCSGNRDENENCKFLLDIPFSISINLNLPQYSQLQFAGNSVYIPNVGNRGVIVAYTGADYFAWDAADPNQVQSSCAIIENSGLEGTSQCDNKNQYSLVTGQPLNNGTLQCSLRNYRVDQNGSGLTISF